MSLVTPLALLLGALAIPIVIFYILKIRLRQVPVSTTIFWRQIYDDKRPRSLWQRLRHLLSLAAQLLLLLLLVFALAQPYFKSEVLAARRVILVVDNSASMKAADVLPSRLDAAKAAALEIISGLRFRDEMAIIAAGAQPRVVCGFSGHERTLRDALSAIEAGDGPTQVVAAVTLARRLLVDAQHGRVAVLSDGCFEGSDKLAEDSDVELHVVGTRAGNVGITNFQVRRSMLDPIGYEILTRVANASDEEVKCRLEIDLNDSPVDVIPLTLAPGEQWSRTIEKTSIDGGRLMARLNWDDVLPLDNTAMAILPKRETQGVVLVTSGNLFLQKALEANPLIDLKVVNSFPASYDSKNIYVFHQRVPSKLPDVNALVIDPIDSTDVWQVGETLENPIVTQQDQESALMRHVRLDNVVMNESRRITPPEGAHVLVGALSDDPLYFSLELQGRKLLLLTVNLDRGDLTFRTAFPIMVTNALAWFAGQAAELRESLSSGAIADVELPAALSQSVALALTSPTGASKPLASGALSTVIGPLDACGIWRILKSSSEGGVPRNAKQNLSPAASTGESTVLELACNLSNRAESDVRVPQALLQERPTATLAGGWFTRPIWFYLVAVALFLTTSEWYLYQRRWIS